MTPAEAKAWFDKEVALLKAAAGTGSRKTENTRQARRLLPFRPDSPKFRTQPFKTYPAWERIHRQPLRNTTNSAARRAESKP